MVKIYSIALISILSVCIKLLFICKKKCDNWVSFYHFILLQLAPSTLIKDIKQQIYRKKKSLYPERQSIRLEVKGSSLKDTEPLSSFGLKTGSKLFLKDLGPQIGWKTVFLAEYAGPIFVYLGFYIRPWLFYGANAVGQPMSQCAEYVFISWVVSLNFVFKLLFLW